MGMKCNLCIAMLLGVSVTGFAHAQNVGEYGVGTQSPLSNTSIVQGMLDMMQLMRQMGSGVVSGSQLASGWDSPSFYPPHFGWSPADLYWQGSQMWPRMTDTTRWREWSPGYSQGGYPFARARGSRRGMLDGRWQSSTGEWLLISGDYFEVRSSEGSARGRLAVQGERLYTYSPELGVSLEYEFALDRERLALRDPYGQLLLFRRASTPGSQRTDWQPRAGTAYGSPYAYPYGIR
jgi:hypothetical protein